MSQGSRLVLFGGPLALALVLVFGFRDGNDTGSQSVNSDMAARGEYLVHIGGCNDCHSPKVFVKMGPMMVPVPDTSRLLSGYPSQHKVPPIPEGILGPDKWGALTTGDLTGWVGPWGMSFTRNLTPDVATGLGSWTEEMFIKTIRTGKQMGEGRDLLPPMPWQEYRHMTDDDLKAIFAYLRTLKPITNAVPDPIPPKMPSDRKGKNK